MWLYIRRSHSSSVTSGESNLVYSKAHGCVYYTEDQGMTDLEDAGMALVGLTVFQILNLFCVFKLQNSGWAGGGRGGGGRLFDLSL